MRFTVEMKWNEPTEQWRMMFKGKMIQEYFDCPNFNRFFKGADKKTPKTYKITIGG